MLCEQYNNVLRVIFIRNCKLKYGNQTRKASYSIPTKWLKKIKVRDYRIYRFSSFKSPQTETAVTFNVPSGVNVTFWPRRIYDGIYDGRRISRRKMGYFVSVTSYSDSPITFGVKIPSDMNRVAEKFIRNELLYNCKCNDAHRTEKNIFAFLENYHDGKR